MKLNLWFESSLRVVRPEEAPPDDGNQTFELHMARNAYASCQLLLHADRDLRVTAISFEATPDTVELRGQFVEQVVFNSGVYSDPLSNEAGCDIPAGYTQSLWITAFAPEGACVGTVGCRVTVDTDQGRYERLFTLEVHAAVLPDTQDAAFSMEYWVNTVNFWFRYPSADQLDFIFHHYGIEKYSGAWWELNKSIAENMRENRINVLFVRTHDLLLDGGTTLKADGTYLFRWELFDRWLDLFIEHARVRYFAGYHLVVQTVGKDAYILRRGESGKMEIAISPIGGDESDNWFSQFLPALRSHLAEKGILGRWLQHIQDEPADADSWLQARDIMRKWMPEVPCMDAIDNQAPMGQLQGAMDWWIPRVDIYEKNRAFYDYRLALGDRRWTYTCCVPTEMNYVNKFMDWPLFHNRVLFWGCFMRGFTGFLHWGYNFWDPSDEWFGLNPDAYFKGDGYIVYPDRKNRRVKSSVRQAVTRDSAQDYELLKLLADRDPDAAYELAGRVIRRFNDFNWNHGAFEDAHRTLLLMLDEGIRK